MLESWGLENLMVYSDVLEAHPLIVGQNQYSYGPGGNWDSARPLRLRDDNFLRYDGLDYPITQMPLADYRARSSKSILARPSILSTLAEHPLMIVFLWPTPDAAYEIHLRAWKQILEFPDMETKIELAPGYARALVSSLAIEIGPMFNKEPSGMLVALNHDAKKQIRKVNSTHGTPAKTDLRSLTLGGGRYASINSGPF